MAQVQIETFHTSNRNCSGQMVAAANVPGLGRRSMKIPYVHAATQTDNHKSVAKAFMIRYLMELSDFGTFDYAGAGLKGGKLREYWNVALVG